ncbi:MAG: DNA-processing protein DprA [Bacteroidota bacterium]
MDQNLIYKIGLTLIPKIGPVISKNLLSHCGSAEAVFSESKKTLTKVPGVGTTLAKNILTQNVLKIAEKEIFRIKKSDIQPLFYTDKAYPSRLKHYNDSPLMIYCKGPADLNNFRMVSVVGTRSPSPSGISFCEKLINDLKKLEVTVVSGMAYGVDIAAHKTCLEHDIPTIGVLGHGLGTIYPSQHWATAHKMIDEGALITEFLYDVKPERANFPMRNRIIAGMCDALVVVETKRKGGSMITAELANSYNKDVFAVPGRLKDENSKGCNHLIKTHQAALIESGKDIAYVMGWDEKAEYENNRLQQSLFTTLKDEEFEVVSVLKQNENLGIDSLYQKIKMSPGALSSTLLTLEFKGLIKSLPGKRYTLV